RDCASEAVKSAQVRKVSRAGERVGEGKRLIVEAGIPKSWLLAGGCMKIGNPCPDHGVIDLNRHGIRIKAESFNVHVGHRAKSPENAERHTKPQGQSP